MTRLLTHHLGFEHCSCGDCTECFFFLSVATPIRSAPKLYGLLRSMDQQIATSRANKNQWPFQEPRLEVPTIYKAYFSGLCKGISPQNMALYDTVPPF